MITFNRRLSFLLPFRTRTHSQPRYISSAPISEPHAYLRPLLPTKSTAELSASAGGEQDGQLEGVMCIVLNRPETRNALSVRMVGEMREALAKFNSMPLPSARILLLRSSSQGQFCSGADLRERRTMSPGQVGAFLDSLRALVGELEGVRAPSVAVVDGAAFGGGAELALGCDLRIGGQHTKIALPETKLGIIPGAGGTQRLARLIGVSRAKELIYTGRAVDGAEAYRLGLLNHLAPLPQSQSVLDQALLTCAQILTSAPLALAAAKTALNMSSGLEEGLDMERKVYEGLLGTEDRMEGLRAFAEKRRAVFKGR